MSRMNALVVLSLLLIAGAATAQQTMQPGQQSGVQQGSQQGALPPWNSPQMVQKLSTAVNQSNADLEKAIDTASSQAKGKAVGAAFAFHQGTGSAAGQSSTAGQSQNLVAHVYVVADNQLKDVIVDAKNNNVLSTETRQMVSNPWAYREGMGAGGSSGSSMDSSQSGSQAQGQGGSQGSTLRERVGMPSSVSMLRLETAQRIVKLADQDNITLQKAISTAEGQAQGAKIVGVFLVLPQQANVGAGAGASEGMSSGETGSQQQQNLYSKVFAVTNDQVKVMTIDAKNDKVIHTETRSTFIGPWEGRMGAAGGAGGTSGQQPQPGTGTGGSTGQPGSTGGSRSNSSGEQFPTGSGQGTGPGSLGG